MKVINYIKENGIKRVFQVIWRYKIEMFLEKIVNTFTKNKPLKNKIVIESHNDFDCNGGAFYDYLIKNKYNEKYEIVWLLKNKCNYVLPKNVKIVYLYKPSFRKAYHICTAKYFLFDCDVINKIRNDQIFVYCSHGAGGLKKAKGKINLPPQLNYILMQSKEYAPIQAEQWEINTNDKRLVFIGYPSFDKLHNNDKKEITELFDKQYDKIILWMPTFRKSRTQKRNDSSKEYPLGIPLFNNLKEYERINEYLKKHNTLLIIKLHPMQSLDDLKINDESNIKVLTWKSVKELNINNYMLMNASDALISDYSGAAYEYLQTDKPIAYVLDDMEEYKLGFVVDDIHKLLAGSEIYTLEDLENFIKDIINNKDIHKEKRRKIRDYIYTYHDDKSCERLAKLLKL